MKTGITILSLAVTLALSLTGCSKNDDFSVSTTDLTGKNWYYNAWRSTSSPYGYSSTDVLDMIRFESGGKLIGSSFGGRRDTLFAYWNLSDGYLLTLDMAAGSRDEWRVTDYGKNYLTINGWGDRTYISGSAFLEGLFGDVFWVNRYVGERNEIETTLGFRVTQEDGSLSEAYALLSDDQKGRIKLEKQGTDWIGYFTALPATPEPLRVRFYCRQGKEHVKFDERISTGNMPLRPWDEAGLNASWSDAGIIPRLKVSWQPYDAEGIYYRVEVYDKNLNLTSPYFVGYTLSRTGELDITASTAGRVNRMGELKKSETYRVRLVAFKHESGIDPNDSYADYNIQAVTYINKSFVWGE